MPADYHARFPKPCMGGWGTTGINVNPEGRVLPCHAAETIPGLAFETVRDRPLAAIWADGPVCAKSPLHARVVALTEGFAAGDDAALVWRRFRDAEAEAVRAGAQVTH